MPKNTEDMIDKIPHIKIGEEVIKSEEVFPILRLHELFVALNSGLNKKEWKVKEIYNTGDYPYIEISRKEIS